MNDYPEPIKEYIAALNPDTQEKAVNAVSDLRQKDMPWLWIEIALNLKPKSDWEKWGFGLMFRDTFKAQVDKKHDAAKRVLKEKGANIAAKSSSPKPQTAKERVLSHEEDLFRLLSCSSWEEIEKKMMPTNFGDAPMWYHPDTNQWYAYTPELFNRKPVDFERGFSVLPKDSRNKAAIAYALENHQVPEEFVEEWQNTLENMGE